MGSFCICLFIIVDQGHYPKANKQATLVLGILYGKRKGGQVLQSDTSALPTGLACWRTPIVRYKRCQSTIGQFDSPTCNISVLAAWMLTGTFSRLCRVPGAVVIFIFAFVSLRWRYGLTRMRMRCEPGACGARQFRGSKKTSHGLKAMRGFCAPNGS